MISERTAQRLGKVPLSEPPMTPVDWQEYNRGWRLFNERKFWHAHEAWENVWKRHAEESRVFFQAIIQLAAAYHLLLEKKRYGGMMGNFEKAERKLKLFPGSFLRVDVVQLLDGIDSARKEIGTIGEQHLERFDVQRIPIIQCGP
jgi:uncharacterized protein